MWIFLLALKRILFIVIINIHRECEVSKLLNFALFPGQQKWWSCLWAFLVHESRSKIYLTFLGFATQPYWNAANIKKIILFSSVLPTRILVYYSTIFKYVYKIVFGESFPYICYYAQMCRSKPPILLYLQNVALPTWYRLCSVTSQLGWSSH